MQGLATADRQPLADSSFDSPPHWAESRLLFRAAGHGHDLFSPNQDAWRWPDETPRWPWAHHRLLGKTDQLFSANKLPDFAARLQAGS